MKDLTRKQLGFLTRKIKIKTKKKRTIFGLKRTNTKGEKKKKEETN